MKLPPAQTLYVSPWLRVTLGPDRLLHLEGSQGSLVTLFAPAIIDASVVPCSDSAGYIHLTGPFQSTTRHGEQRNFRNIGPYSLEEAQDVVDILGAALDLPMAPLEVAYHDLILEPARFRNRLVRSQGPWRRVGGRSLFAGAWLMPPDEWNTYGESDCVESPEAVVIDVVGLWTASGGSAVLDVFLLEVLSDLEPLVEAQPRLLDAAA